MNVMMAPFSDRVMAAQSISEDIFSYLFGSNIKRKMRRLFQDQFTSTSGKKSDRIPLILDWDANYDDTLALIYLLSNPLFDVKAVTSAGTGFATPSGGPINSQMVLEMFNMGHIPVSYGSSTSLSPITQAPLQWRIELFSVNKNGEQATRTLDNLDSYYRPHCL